MSRDLRRTVEALVAYDADQERLAELARGIRDDRDVAHYEEKKEAAINSVRAAFQQDTSDVHSTSVTMFMTIAQIRQWIAEHGESPAAA